MKLSNTMTYSNIQRLGNDHLAFWLNYKNQNHYLILLDEDINDSVLAIHDFGMEDVILGDMVLFQVSVPKDKYFDAFFNTSENEQHEILDHFFETNSCGVERVISDWLEYTDEYLKQ